MTTRPPTPSIDSFPLEDQDVVMARDEATYWQAYEDGVADTLAQLGARTSRVLLPPLPVLEKLEDYQQAFLDELWEDMESGRWSSGEPRVHTETPEPEEDAASITLPPPRRRYTPPKRRGRSW